MTPTPRPPTRDTLDEVRLVERDLAVLKADLAQRLNMGAEAMSTIRGQLAEQAGALVELGKKRPTPWLAIAGFVMSSLFPIGGLIFAAGRYPDREEFEAAKMRGEERLEQLRGDVAELQREAVRVRVQLEDNGAATGRIETGLERLQQALKRR